MCIYTKQIIFDFTKNNIPVFACFIDIKKAFDRGNNDKLTNILVDKQFPYFIIDICEG